MKTLNLRVTVDNLRLSDAEKQHIESFGFGGLLESLLIQGLSFKYKDGIGGAKQRVLNRILDKLDFRKDDIELEESEFDLLKEVFLDENVKFHPSQSRLICQYMDKVEKLLS